MKKKFEKSSMWLVLIVLFLCLLFYYGGYLLGSTINKENNNEVENKEDLVEDKNDENLDEDSMINEVVYEDGTFVVKTSKWENGDAKFSINGKFVGTTCGIDDFKVIKNKYLYFNNGCGSITKVLYNKDGEEVFKDDKDYIIKNVLYKDDIIDVYYMNYISDYAASLCQEKDYNKLAMNEIKYNVLDDGKLEKVSSVTKTINEVIKDKYGMTCEELKVTADKKYEYDKNLANGN